MGLNPAMTLEEFAKQEIRTADRERVRRIRARLTRHMTGDDRYTVDLAVDDVAWLLRYVEETRLAKE